MADENKNLITTLTDTRLPAKPGGGAADEPIDPGSGPSEEAGERAAAPVVRERTAEAPAGPVEREAAQPPAERKPAAPKKYKINGRDYTLAELEANGLVEGLLTKAGQHD